MARLSGTPLQWLATLLIALLLLASTYGAATGLSLLQARHAEGLRSDVFILLLLKTVSLAFLVGLMLMGIMLSVWRVSGHRRLLVAALAACAAVLAYSTVKERRLRASVEKNLKEITQALEQHQGEQKLKNAD